MKDIKVNLTTIFIALSVGGTIGIALKFITFFDKLVYFPFFPNILDSIFLVAATCFLGYRTIRAEMKND